MAMRRQPCSFFVRRQWSVATDNGQLTTDKNPSLDA
jgi:hypothetical protein